MIALAGNFTANPLEILRPSGFVALLGRGCDLVVLSKLSFDMRLLGKDYNTANSICQGFTRLLEFCFRRFAALT
ncbi:MAG: hypothetical protein WAU53_03385 [Rhodoplanes sp.]